MTRGEYAIDLYGVTKRHAGASAFSLAGVTIRIAVGEMVAIHGRSGAGKTTLLKIMAGVMPPTCGTVVVHDAAEARSRGSQPTSPAIRAVFDTPRLVNRRSAVDHLVADAEACGWSAERARGAAHHVLATTGLAGKAHVRAGALSSGERQRLAIARALVIAPRILLIDEPGRHLDWASAEDVIAAVRGLRDAFGSTIAFATSDAAIAAYADRIISLADGTLQHECALDVAAVSPAKLAPYARALR